MIQIDPIGDALGDLIRPFIGTPFSWGGFISGAVWMFMINDAAFRRRWRRRLRPTAVRREYRAAILQAKSVLRLIESTHFFEDNLGASIAGFLPRGDSEDYKDAFKRTYLAKATSLYATQRAWAGAVRPGPFRQDDW